MTRIAYAIIAYIGAAITISQPGAAAPGNRSLITIDDRIRPGISEITFGASASIDSIANANGATARLYTPFQPSSRICSAVNARPASITAHLSGYMKTTNGVSMNSSQPTSSQRRCLRQSVQLRSDSQQIAQNATSARVGSSLTQ